MVPTSKQRNRVKDVFQIASHAKGMHFKYQIVNSLCRCTPLSVNLKGTQPLLLTSPSYVPTPHQVLIVLCKKK